MSKIIKSNVATILNNDPSGDRVLISIATEIIDGESDYFLITDSGEDCGPHFANSELAENAIYDLWGKSAEWDLQLS